LPEQFQILIEKSQKRRPNWHH